MYKKTNKIVASIIVFMMMITQVSSVGIHVGGVFATDTNINNQDATTEHKNVEFDTYFVEGENKVHEVTKNIGEENKVVAQITVKDAGYLKNAKVEFLDANFNIVNSIKSEKVATVNGNTISFNQIDAGEDIKLEIPFTFEHEDEIEISEFDKVNSTKFTATYIDEKGKEHEIEKEILLGVKWTAQVEAMLDSEVVRYIPYDINGQKGLILQTIIKSYVKDNLLPIKENNIEVVIPKINGIAPKSINVYSKNGQEIFGEGNYQYDASKLTINTKNTISTEEKITWKNEIDEYIVTYLYSEEVLNTITEEGVNANISVNSNIKVYNYNEEILTANYDNVVTLTEKIGDIVDLSATLEENLSKGYIYANYEAQEKIETTYNEELTVSVAALELAEKITINVEEDKFLTKDTEYASNTYFKNLKINKEIFNKILGIDGYIEIYSGDTLLSTINKNSTEEVINLNVDEIRIEINKPENIGELVFDFEKAIKTDIAYRKAQVESFTKLQSEWTLNAVDTNIEVVNKIVNSETELVEPTTKAEIQISDNNLSTVVVNENIEIKVILNTNSIYNKLYKDPVITIDLPSYIEKMEVKNVQLAFEEEMTIKNANLIENEDGTKQIVIELSGAQTKYSIDAISGGANIVITADIIANELTPNKQEQMKMTCINQVEQVEDVIDINFIAPTGIVTVNKIENYAVGAASVMALTQDEQATLEVTTTAKTATAEIQVINNYNNIINNIQILGRTLVQGTTDIDSENELNNTFDAPMLGAISANELENVTIYYTENGSATSDLNDSENAWTTEISDFSKVKSYLIILNDYTMNIGDSVEFTYEVQIPENLGYSEVVNSVYTVYFDNVQEEQTLQDKAKSRMVTLATGDAPTLEVELTSASAENSTVREGQYVKFKAIIKNTGTVDAQNVRLNVTAPNVKLYTYRDSENKIQFTEDTSLITDTAKQLVAEYSTKHTEFVQDNFTSEYQDNDNPEKNFVLGLVKVGEQVEVEYELRMMDVNVYKMNSYLDENNVPVLPETILNNTARVIADDMQKEVISNEYKLKLDAGYLKVTMEADKFFEYTLIKGDRLTYSVKVESIHDVALNNVKVNVQIPEGLIIKNTDIKSLIITTDYTLDYTYEIDEENNIVTFNIKELPEDWMMDCNVMAEVGDIEGIITCTATVDADEIGTHYSNQKSNKVSKLKFEIKQLAPEKQYVKETEQVTYIYEIENISDIYTNSFKFENKIPEGMKLIGAQIIKDDVTTQFNNEEEGSLIIDLNSFKPSSKMIVKVTMQANLLPQGITEKEVTNYATISGDKFETVNSNSIKTVIEYNEDAHKVDYGDAEKPDGDGNNGDNNDDIVRYKISGLAWLDVNEDGQRDENETLLSGIEVRLLNKNTNDIVKDVTTGNAKITNTSSNGEYVFTNLEDGEYLVVFVYNTSRYELTQYKKAQISEIINSDFINVNMNIDGKDKKVAISDTIKIQKENVRNVDIGLYESDKSDLRLDKYVSSITLTYGNTVKTYDYEDAKIAKIEIPANEVSNATVIVEYKIVVTNEAAIANYVRKIVDYIPAGMKFNSELNRDWYESSNGDLYNSSLANTKLESGESLEVTLTLTRKMTDNNLGIVNNNAEIYEVYNEEAVLDIDSTAGNKVTSEDDMSAADVVISVKTGDAIIYTTIISTIICIALGVSIFYIRKLVLRRM